MSYEIEHRFMANVEAINTNYPHNHILQRYICFEPHATRIRVIDSSNAFITVKLGGGLVREEFEYPIPLEDAMEIVNSSKMYTKVINKIRFSVPDTTWTLDLYEDRLSGLVIAETETLEVPKFIHGIIPIEVTNRVEANAEFLSTCNKCDLVNFIEEIYNAPYHKIS